MGGGAVGRGTCYEKPRAVMGARAGRDVPANCRLAVVRTNRGGP